MTDVLVYMDDKIIYSDTLKEHFKHLKAVSQKLKGNNLKIQFDKTELLER